jgi:hypothetical protein
MTYDEALALVQNTPEWRAARATAGNLVSVTGSQKVMD